MELVKDYVVGLDLSNFYFTDIHQLSIGVKLHVFRLITVRCLSKVFKLRLIYVP